MTRKPARSGALRSGPDAPDASGRLAADHRFRTLFERAPIAMMLVDRTGAIELANSAAAEVFGSTTAALVGRWLESLVSEPFREELSRLRAGWSAATTQDPGVCLEVVGLRADGGEIPLTATLQPVQFVDCQRTLVTATDMSVLRRVESEATLQREELAHLSRVTMIGELSGALAHELNQPLMAILSNAQAAQRLLARQPPDCVELQEILSDIVNDDRRAGEVIRRMRALLKKGRVDLAPLDINELIMDVLRLVRSELINRSVGARVHLARGLPAVRGDPVQLQQVLVNLLFNGCDAMQGLETGRVIEVRTTLADDGAVRVSVEDAGCGIPPAMLERIFEPFETTKSDGMGLGLAVCRTIMVAHGGRIWAENLTPGARISLEFAPAGDTT